MGVWDDVWQGSGSLLGVLVKIVIHPVDGGIGQLLLLGGLGRHGCGEGLVEVVEDFVGVMHKSWTSVWCMGNDTRTVATVEWDAGSQGLAARASLGDVDVTACDCDCDREGGGYVGSRRAGEAGCTVMPKAAS